MTDVLRDRDPNLQPEQTAVNTAGKPLETTQKPATSQGQSKSVHDNQNLTYVSPSDSIMSPASKKLSDLKQKQISKSMPKRSLFAKAVTSRGRDLGPA